MFLAPPALWQGVPHLGYVLAKKVPPCICFEPVSCLFYVMPIRSCFGRDGEQSSQFTFSMAFMTLESAVVSSARLSLLQTGIFNHSPYGSHSVPLVILVTFFCIICGLIYVLRIGDQNYSLDSNHMDLYIGITTLSIFSSNLFLIIHSI